MYLKIPNWMLCVLQWLCAGDYYKSGSWWFTGRAIGPLVLQMIRFRSERGTNHYFSVHTKNSKRVPITVLVESSGNYLKIPNWAQCAVIRLYAGEYDHIPGTHTAAYLEHYFGPFTLRISHMTFSNETRVDHYLTLHIGLHDYSIAHFMEDEQ